MTAVLPHLILYFPTAAAVLPHDGDAKPPDRIHHDFPDHLPAGVRSLIGSRCERFQPPALPYDRQHFAFTHVPKMGGTSMQVFLQRVARRAGKVVFNVRTQAKALNLTMDQMRKRASGADVLIGHAPIWWEEQAKSLNWRGGNFSRVTMMRDPIDTIQSGFRYNKGDPASRIRAIYAQNLTLQQGYQKFLEEMCYLRADGTCRNKASNMMAYHSPVEESTVEDVMLNVVRGYAVVGMLNRLAETLEVMKCRLPWVGSHLPQDFPHANQAPYPMRLKDDMKLMQDMVADEIQLFVLANLILSADVACCRAAARGIVGHAHQHLT